MSAVRRGNSVKVMWEASEHGEIMSAPSAFFPSVTAALSNHYLGRSKSCPRGQRAEVTPTPVDPVGPRLGKSLHGIEWRKIPRDLSHKPHIGCLAI